ncbi:MAG: prepilin peptidase [Caldisericia bacterium]|nr:prepilin peptidase [Caldisericia bacterium]
MMYQLPLVYVLIVFSIVVVVCIVSVITDIKTRKILNAVTLPAFLLGITINPLFFKLSGLNPLNGLLNSLYGLIIGFGFFFVFYIVGKGKNMGAGDVKLMGAIGSLVGWQMTVNSIIFTSFVGLIVAIILFFPLLYTLIFSGNAASLKDYGKMTVPYGVSIGIGTLIAVGFRLLYIAEILEVPLFI